MSQKRPIVAAYMILHYGIEYLEWAIRSVIDEIDYLFVLYTPIGSNTQQAPRPCPESRDDLKAAAERAAGDKLVWTEGTWPREGMQRDAAKPLALAADVDILLVLDADEIWPAGLVQQVVALWPDAPYNVRVPIVHFWRSFWRCIIHDPAYPVRALFLHGRADEMTLGSDLRIAHFGYAQSANITEYKLWTHIHRPEWRKDIDWFQARFLANAQQDCHPVGSQYWNPEPVDALAYMPEWMAEHPYFGLEVIP